ncbi:hypothetical protein L873DRAFT_420871 [Choiromyces venosus 120613-1]|uniref:Uncharacterized protein n=1 Tax=Choiromyces venosus 120613-1 TaxID=1336337 RepID=A0A3N4JW77_9PEZI|nr:hypothetical protein L873DRAFT_420871 [Choiromyces venosus 120613-1]
MAGMEGGRDVTGPAEKPLTLSLLLCSRARGVPTKPRASPVTDMAASVDCHPDVKLASHPQRTLIPPSTFFFFWCAL